jgi:alpha-tubulin suppressor-like RCC1 family protein
MEDADWKVGVRPLPGRVPSLNGRVLEVAAGGNTCAITVERELYCWGSENGDIRFDSYRPVPQLRTLGGPVLSVGMNAMHSCVVRGDHSLWCWGSNSSGQLGNGQIERSAKPVYPPPAQQVQKLGQRVRQACVGYDTSCALDVEGKVWCWGDPPLVPNASTNAALPTQVSLARPAVELACGNYHACVLQDNDQMWCWGRNLDGELGDGRRIEVDPFRSGPVAVAGLPTTPVAMALGSRFSLVLDAGGAVWMFGKSPVPNDTEGSSLVPRRVEGLERVVQIVTGSTHSCALTADETVWCWGTGQDHELGNGKGEHQRKPVRVVFPKP